MYYKNVEHSTTRPASETFSPRDRCAASTADTTRRTNSTMVNIPNFFIVTRLTIAKEVRRPLLTLCARLNALGRCTTLFLRFGGFASLITLEAEGRK